MSPAPQRINILLVEDSPADVFLVQEALRSHDLAFGMDVADDGEAAIKFINQLDLGTYPPPNILLIDLNVPRKSGLQVLERLRRSPRCEGIPVIVISSSDSPTDRKRAFDLGATEYFRKPSTLDEFMELGQVVGRLCCRTRTSAA